MHFGDGDEEASPPPRKHTDLSDEDASPPLGASQASPPPAELPHEAPSSSKHDRVVKGVSWFGVDIPEKEILRHEGMPHQQHSTASLGCDTPRSKLSKRSVLSRRSVASKSLRALFRRKTSVCRPNFNGRWTCTATWGLDAFLKDAGVSKMQRLAALGAPWPTWEFEQKSESITFTNHTILGDISESFQVGGPEYVQVDGRKQMITSRAFWEGDQLVIDRTGPQGRFREERRIDAEDQLHFLLKSADKSKEISWGRTFRREG